MRKLLIAAIVIFLLSNISFAEHLTLGQSVNMSLQNNESVIIAKKKAEAAQARVGQAFASYLPTISLSSSYSRNFTSPIKTLFGGVPVTFGIDEAAHIKGWEATLTQNVFTFGKLENALLMALDGSRLAKEELRKANQDIIYNTTSAYYEAIKAQKFVVLSEESLEMAKAHLDQVKALFKVGMATKADILPSEVAVLSASETLIRAKNGLEIANSLFNNIIGKKLEEPVFIEETKFDSSAAIPDIDYSELLKDAYNFRPDLRAVNISEGISGKALNAAVAGWLPVVVLQGSYGWRNTDYTVNALNYDAASWNVAAAASWTLFDGFSTQSKIKEAQANLSSAQAGRSLVKKAVELDVKQAYLNYVLAKNILNTAQKRLDSAKENYEVAEIRYKSGLGTNIEVLDAQTALTKANMDLLSVQFDMHLALAQITKAAGVSDLKNGENYMNKASLEGVVKFIDLEGGFIGFIDKAGNKYDLSGSKADEILKTVGKSGAEKKIKVSGYPKKNVVTIHMWGTPFEVGEYEWK